MKSLMFQAQKAKGIKQILKDGNNQEPTEIMINMIAKIYKKENSYQVHFLGEWITFNKEKEANNKANELNFEYFSNHKEKLPKGITVDIDNKRFRFFIRLDHKTVKHIKSSKDLNKLIEVRNHILKNLLSLF